jgi:hypothetical protein
MPANYITHSSNVQAATIVLTFLIGPANFFTYKNHSLINSVLVWLEIIFYKDYAQKTRENSKT